MKPAVIRAAAVQLVSSDDPAANLDLAAALIGQAAEEGAKLVVLPENFAFMGRNDAQRLKYREADMPGQGQATPLQDFLSDQAAMHKIWLVGGTVPLCGQDPDRACSAMLLFAPDGSRRARYDKIHLFDVTVPGSDTQYQESGSTEPGSAACVAATDFGKIGLAVCYDLRFPELFRSLAGEQLAVIAIGSAFTVPTGRAHWHTLVRARAIENLTAVVAASQGGAHRAGRETYGHSMIVDAWGRILGEIENGAGIVVADIDLAAQWALRREFPALDHRRDFTISPISEDVL